MISRGICLEKQVSLEKGNWTTDYSQAPGHLARPKRTYPSASGHRPPTTGQLPTHTHPSANGHWPTATGQINGHSAIPKKAINQRGSFGVYLPKAI